MILQGRQKMNSATVNIAALLDTEGFLSEPATWNDNIARMIARNDGFPELTKDHWLIIHALREHYKQFGTAPPAFSHICHEHHLDRHCIKMLFRSEREAWRIAGLPDPGEEAKTYM
jgi:TusE/DsrC/DsvC family sulfur relay protein